MTFFLSTKKCVNVFLHGFWLSLFTWTLIFRYYCKHNDISNLIKVILDIYIHEYSQFSMSLPDAIWLLEALFASSSLSLN